jgi:catechol 2,3-dioxygenase-like lactoylglutathione lyase family enzyme
MLDHVSIGVRDLAAARRFYDAVLARLGYRCLYEYDAGAGYGAEHPQFWLGATEHPVAPDDRSGLHICFHAPTRAAVDLFHATALKAGGRDNGKPGPRPDYGPSYYAGFVYDLDGYRIEAHCGEA